MKPITRVKEKISLFNWLLLVSMLVLTFSAHAAPRFTVQKFYDTNVILSWKYTKSYSKQVKRVCLQRKISGKYISIYCAKANKLSVKLLDAVNANGRIDYRLVINKKKGSDKLYRKIILSSDETLESDSTTDQINNEDNSGNSEVTFSSACPTGLADQMMSQINQVRVSNGLSNLSYSSRLALAADWHARSNALNKNLTHDGWYQRINDSGFKYSSISQNIANAYQGTQIEVLVELWMNSSGHRLNILDPKMTVTGISCAVADNGIVYWAQNFGLPR
jgi:uncharacterized protein YkwD